MQPDDVLPDRASATPRWVRTFGIIAVVLLLLALLVIVGGVGGPHGPDRHMMHAGDAHGGPEWELLVLVGVLAFASVALNGRWLAAVGAGRRWPTIARARPRTTMTPRLRKLVLTAHVTSSVGFLGAVASFLALAVAGLAVADAQMARAAYQAMAVITWAVIVPSSFAALLTGVAQSLWSPWGVVQHYWVLVKLLLTLFTTVVLLVQTGPIGIMAEAAATTAVSSADLRGLRISLVGHAAGGLLVLVVATVLSIYKPRGLTRHGMRQQRARAAPPQS